LTSCCAVMASNSTVRSQGRRSALGKVSGSDQFLDLVGEGDEVRDAGLDLAVDIVDIGLLAVVGKQVPQVGEVLEPVRERSLDHPMAGDGVEDVVVRLGLRQRERGHEIPAGTEEQLDRLLEVP